MKMLLMAALLWPMATYAISLNEPMTVKEFVTTFRPPEMESGKHVTDAEFMAYWRAQGYLDGVKEATKGRLWCIDHKTSSLELDLEIWGRLRALPGARQQQLAGPIILNQLIRHYPCQKDLLP